MSYPDNATASIAQMLFRDSAGAMYIIPRRAFHNGAGYGDPVTMVQDLSGNGIALTGAAIFDRQSFYGSSTLNNVRDAQYLRDVNMVARAGALGECTVVLASPGMGVDYREEDITGDIEITEDFSLLIIIDRQLTEPEIRAINELARLWGGANWTPEALFAGGSDGIFWHYRNPHYLWTDEARTQHPENPGDPIWWIDDQSGNENHWKAPTSAARGRWARWPASAVRAGEPRNRLLSTDNLADYNVWGPTVVSVPEYSSEFDDWQFEITVPQNTQGIQALPTLNTLGYVAGRIEVRKLETHVGNVNVRLRESQDSASSWRINVALNAETGEYNTVILSGFTGGATVEDGGSHWVVTLWVDDADIPLRLMITTSQMPAGTLLAFRRPRLEDQPITTPYQRVGAGIWDVTEEGQPDVWYLQADGVSTRYQSTRGIPTYQDGVVNILMGVTVSSEETGYVISNVRSPGNIGGAGIVSNAGIESSVPWRSFHSGLLADSAPGSYPVPTTNIVMTHVDSHLAQVTMTIDYDDPIESGVGAPGELFDSPYVLYGRVSGGNHTQGNDYGGVLLARPMTETEQSTIREYIRTQLMGGIAL